MGLWRRLGRGSNGDTEGFVMAAETIGGGAWGVSMPSYLAADASTDIASRSVASSLSDEG